ncbi:LOW QUALITY PROTEIN: GDNF family receptor alpha-4-like [Alosa alosa]|uniref:LOW QUALITY PROTEIN: GDNF family receptor alpha-4-like n=1 Tax=Alosa alosa TaxID=278164 RepID=UPI0020152A79|nr:LOW QUALITY PROTEIN: GDNF family receptor alpha-4-like [Alosa alosa]
MILLGVLLNIVISGTVQAVAPPIDCLEAEQACVVDAGCVEVYRVLEYCSAEEAVAPLGPEARRECLEAQSTLQYYRPLQECKCHRGSRREELCLEVYWTWPGHAYDEYDVSPYADLELAVVRNIELSRMASMIAVSSLPLDGQNQCLKAAQDCGLYEKCGSLRSEYVVACTKVSPGSNGYCNRQKCHRALRRFLERVPEEYVFSLLFCSCTNELCAERRRKTIVPSCSYEERDSKPNCLSLQGYCMRDELCRSRLADFQHNCQSSAHSPTGCMRETGTVCLKAYAGLIGTIMTPNYLSNSSKDVALWCSCEGSGNHWSDCQRVFNMFTSNSCLKNAISSLGSIPVPTPETTPAPTFHPSPHMQQDHGNGVTTSNGLDNVKVIAHGNGHLNHSANSLPGLRRDEEAEEEDEDEDEEFNVIPPYSKKKSSTGADAWGVHRGSAPPSPRLQPTALLLLLVSSALGLGYLG